MVYWNYIKTGVHIHRTSSMQRIYVIPCYNNSSNSLMTDLGCAEESSLLWYEVVSIGSYRRFGVSCCLHLRVPRTDHITLREPKKILRNVHINQWTPCHVPEALNPYQHRHARPVEGCRNHLPSTLVLYQHCRFRLRVGTAPTKILKCILLLRQIRVKKTA
jgi:hypothetical protein